MDCDNIEKTIQDIPNIIKIDIKKISSNRTLEFEKLAGDILQSDNQGELWITSALRFFNMEDIMR